MTASTRHQIVDFFKDRKSAYTLFKAILRITRQLSTPTVEVSRTQISFAEKYKYLWVWLPQTWIRKRADNSITLTFVTGKRIRNARIEAAVQPKKGFWTHHVVINNLTEIDAELESFIRAAHDFCLKRQVSKK